MGRGAGPPLSAKAETGGHAPYIDVNRLQPYRFAACSLRMARYARPRPLVPLRNVSLNFHAYLSKNGQNGEINLTFHAYLSDFPLNNQINMNFQL
jgi:hypothetical protein